MGSKKNSKVNFLHGVDLIFVWMFSWCLIIFLILFGHLHCPRLAFIHVINIANCIKEHVIPPGICTIWTKWVPSSERCILCCVFHFQLIFLACLDRQNAQGQFSNFLFHCCSWCCDFFFFFWYSGVLQKLYFLCVYKKRMHDTWSGVDVSIKNSGCVLKYILMHFYCMCILPECLPELLNFEQFQIFFLINHLS